MIYNREEFNSAVSSWDFEKINSICDQAIEELFESIKQQEEKQKAEEVAEFAAEDRKKEIHISELPVFKRHSLKEKKVQPVINETEGFVPQDDENDENDERENYFSSSKPSLIGAGSSLFLFFFTYLLFDSFWAQISPIVAWIMFAVIGMKQAETKNLLVSASSVFVLVNIYGFEGNGVANHIAAFMSGESRNLNDFAFSITAICTLLASIMWSTEEGYDENEEEILTPEQEENLA